MTRCKEDTFPVSLHTLMGIKNAWSAALLGMKISLYVVWSTATLTEDALANFSDPFLTFSHEAPISSQEQSGSLLSGSVRFMHPST